MKSTKADVPNDDQSNDVIFLDGATGVYDFTRRAARGVIRKALEERLEKNKKLLVLKEKMYGKQDEGKNGQNLDRDVKRID
jgi:hypothetical protein